MRSPSAGVGWTVKPGRIRSGLHFLRQYDCARRGSFSGGAHRSMRGGTRKDLGHGVCDDRLGRRLEALHGLPPGGFGGTFDDWVAALHPDDRAECIRRVERALANPSPYVLLHRCTWPDGSIHWIECRGRVTVDADGAPTGTMGVAIDVTTREQRAAAVARGSRKSITGSLHRALPQQPTPPLGAWHAQR